MGIFKITFLGTGTAIPTLKRRHSSIHILYQSKHSYSMLFDCGEGTQTRLQEAGINFMRINNIFITHWHADHFIGLYGLLNTMGLEGREREIRIFGPNAKEIGPKLFEFFKFPFKIRFVNCREGKLLESEEFFVESTKMKHTIENYAYAIQEKDRINLNKEKIKKLKFTWRECREIKEKGKIKKEGRVIKLEEVADKTKGKRVVYSGDTRYLKKMEKFCKDAFLIHDCTFFSREDLKDKYHSTLEDVVKLRKFAKKIFLTHIGRKYLSQKELEKKVEKYKNIVVTKDLMTVTL